ncbi:hypothetical protein SM12VA4_26120 [Serratia marcescens]|nr:hypothetical protein SM12VA4_26120 [Serratia marcescens]BEM49114.1 hypothetical protein SME17J_26080 [Serratia marcescens]
MYPPCQFCFDYLCRVRQTFNITLVKNQLYEHSHPGLLYAYTVMLFDELVYVKQ